MGRGNYIPPVSSSYAEYDTIYVDKECVYGEDYWEQEDNDFYFEYLEFKDELISRFTDRFRSFEKNDSDWLNDYRTKIVADNRLCMLTVCDDDTYIAVSVIAKDDDYDQRIVNIANRHVENYAKGLKEIILDMYGEYRYRTSAWTSARVVKEIA
jgi:hypothetical protein